MWSRLNFFQKESIREKCATICGLRLVKKPDTPFTEKYGE